MPPVVAAPSVPGVKDCLPITMPDAVTWPFLPSKDTGLSPSTFTTPSPAKLTLPEPAVFVIDVILVKSPLTFTLYVVAFVSASVPGSTDVFVPSITLTAFLASFWISVLPALVILDKSFLATPVIVAVLFGILSPLPST